MPPPFGSVVELSRPRLSTINICPRRDCGGTLSSSVSHFPASPSSSSTLNPNPTAMAPPPSAVDPRLWWAFAGPSTRLPPIGSRVCYFPEGHAEHAWHPPKLSSGGAAFFSCRVVGASLFANARSDEVFAEIHLDPSPSAAPAAAAAAAAAEEEEDASAAAAWSGGDGGMAWYAKILTASDANCGGGFSVPRSCADHIFPPLDFTADPPVQTLSISDLHGNVWKFRHIYRGSPRRHLLTTGWSNFADSKLVVSGDAMVFVKDKSNGDLFVSFRRALRLDSPFLPFLAEIDLKIDPEEDERAIGELGFSRCVRGRIPSANVVEAARSAALGHPFKVLYYPTAGLPEFVVPEDQVDAAIRVPWKPGIRAKLSVEDANSFTTHDVWGTVAEIAEHWAQSPWRMLKVTWDKPEVMKNRSLDKVSPWQVEIVSSTPALQMQNFENSHLKNWRVLENSGSLSDERRWRVLENSGSLGDERNNILNPKYKSGETVTSVIVQSPKHPAGMQGARQDPICFLPTKRNEVAGSSSSIDSTSQRVEIVPGEMNIVNISHSSSILPGQEDMLNGGSEPSSTPAFSQPKCIRTVLFGQTIIIERPPAGGDADRQ